MPAPSRPAQLAGNHRTEVRRLMTASPEQVFAMWVDAEGMADWLCGGGSATLDVRVGGRYHLDMHYEGKSYAHDGEYLEISPPRRLVFTWISESTLFKPSVVTIELTPRGAQTELVLTHEGLPDAKSVADHHQGWTEIVELLAARLP